MSSNLAREECHGARPLARLRKRPGLPPPATGHILGNCPFDLPPLGVAPSFGSFIGDVHSKHSVRVRGSSHAQLILLPAPNSFFFRGWPTPCRWQFFERTGGAINSLHPEKEHGFSVVKCRYELGL